MPQAHCFKVMELALRAEAMATRLGNLRGGDEPAVPRRGDRRRHRRRPCRRPIAPTPHGYRGGGGLRSGRRRARRALATTCRARRWRPRTMRCWHGPTSTWSISACRPTCTSRPSSAALAIGQARAVREAAGRLAAPRSSGSMRGRELPSRAVVPVYQYRYGNGLARLRRLIETGAHRPLAGRQHRDALEPPARLLRRALARPQGDRTGRRDPRPRHPPHDLLTFTLGPVRRVFAKLATRVNAIETEDCAAICLEMASGALVTSSVTLGAAEELTQVALLLHRPDGGEPRRAAVSAGRGRLALRRRAGRAGRRRSTRRLQGFAPRQESFAGLFEALHPALAGTAPWPLTVQDA